MKKYFDKEEDFKNFQFGYLGLLCNNEATRPKLELLRNMDTNDEFRKQQIANFREWTKHTKQVLERLEAAPDEELDAVAIKISLYINMFTRMYFE